MVYDVITFSRWDIHVISLVYDKCVKDANGYGFPDGHGWPVPAAAAARPRADHIGTEASDDDAGPQPSRPAAAACVTASRSPAYY